MIDIYIFIIFLTISLIFSIVGFLKEQYMLIIFSGILFLILGGVFITGLQYITGSNVSLITGNNYSVVDTITTYNSQFKIPFSIFLFLTGLSMIFIGIFSYFYPANRDREVEYEAEE